MSDVAIRVENLGKKYRIGQRERYLALRDVLTNALTLPLRLFKRNSQPQVNSPRSEWIWALKDVSFEVKRGEVVGIIGRNGAGKTTLLKILARITKPTEGRAEIHGRIGSLLEVGTGFHPELTGRENIYLSGAILGMNKREIERKFHEMVDFAGVEKFLDTPVKHYSGGMQMRLAFAVAAHLDPEILLVDEVLAVGDLEFQKKCLGKMQEVSKGGRTVLFVSHQMNQIRKLCESVMWLEEGEIKQVGSAHSVVGNYERALTSIVQPLAQRSDGLGFKARFLSWEILESGHADAHTLRSGGAFTLRIKIEVKEPIRMCLHGIHLYNAERQMMWGTGFNGLEFQKGVFELGHNFPYLPLKPGPYTWFVTMYDEHGLVDKCECVPDLLVATVPMTQARDEWAGILNIPSHLETKMISETDVSN